MAAAEGAFLRSIGVRKLETWFRAHGDLLVLAVIAASLLAQVAATRDRSLNPDEALTYGFINLPGPVAAYERTRTGSAHPPLFFLALYFWTLVGRSEFFLRLLSELFGAGFLWFVYRWTGRLFGMVAGFLAVLIIVLSPMWPPLTSEVRDYSLMLLLSMAALAEFEIGVEERSEVKILLSAVFLCLAILSHYSAIFVTASFVTYQLVRLRMTRAPRKLFATWAVCQGAVAAVYLFLYFTQLKSLRGSAMEDRAVTTWLRLGYFEHGRENPVWFVVRQAKELFLYFFGSSYLAAVSIVLTVAGLIVFGRRRHPAVLLFALPFVLGAAAGLLGAYPFSGTRHSAYLIPAVAVPMAVAVSALFETRRRASLLVLAALVPLCWSSPVWSTSAHSLSDMNDAVAYIRGRAAPGSLLFSDHRTGSVLSYYLGRDARNTERAGLEDFRERYTGGYCLVDSPVWAPDPKAFGDELERMIRVYRLPPGQRLRVARLGFEYDSARVLSSRFPDAIFPDSRNFGELSIVEIWLGDGSEEREPQGKGRGLAGAGQ